MNGFVGRAFAVFGNLADGGDKLVRRGGNRLAVRVGFLGIARQQRHRHDDFVQLADGVCGRAQVLQPDRIPHFSVFNAALFRFERTLCKDHVQKEPCHHGLHLGNHGLLRKPVLLDDDGKDFVQQSAKRRHQPFGLQPDLYVSLTDTRSLSDELQVRVVIEDIFPVFGLRIFERNGVLLVGAHFLAQLFVRNEFLVEAVQYVGQVFLKGVPCRLSGRRVASR